MFYGGFIEELFRKKAENTSRMSVATYQDFKTLDEDIFKSYLYKDQEIKKMVNLKLCCPDLLNLELDVFLGCKNQQCNKTLNLLSEAKIVTYHNSSRSMHEDKYSSVFHCAMSFEDKIFTLPIEINSAFLKEDVINMCQTDTDTFKEKLLFLENIDYIYNS